jgi:hypothetical protein
MDFHRSSNGRASSRLNATSSVSSLVSLASFACPFSCERRSRSRAQSSFRDDVSVLHPIPPTESMFFWLSSSATLLLLLLLVVLRRRKCQPPATRKEYNIWLLFLSTDSLSHFPAPSSVFGPSVFRANMPWSTSHLMSFVLPQSLLSLENPVRTCAQGGRNGGGEDVRTTG